MFINLNQYRRTLDDLNDCIFTEVWVHSIVEREGKARRVESCR